MSRVARQAAALAAVAMLAAVFDLLAWQYGKPATATLLGSIVIGAFAAFVGLVDRHARVQRQIEHRPLAPADRVQARHRILLDHAPLPVLFETIDGSLHAANRAARRLFGVEDRLPADLPDLRGALVQAASGERSVVTLDTQAGAGRRFAVTVASATGAGGLSRLVALADIDAELHLAEAEIRRALMDVLSHEIMNSLTPIVSLVETAAELRAAPASPRSAAELDEALATALRRARGLDRFVQGYRQLARIPPPRLARVDLGEVLAMAAVIFRTRWGDRVAFELATPVQPVVAMLDAELIDQALLHLLNNAAEAALAAAQAPRVGLACDADRQALSISVFDNGAGVAEAQREAIFRPFFSLKPGGSGIGLSVARQIALEHGGDVRLAPPPAGWTTCFTLAL